MDLGSDAEGFWGTEGAGALLVARGTGRVFLVLRSAKVRNPGTWGLPGGALDEGESPRQGAARELMEEVGYTGRLDLRSGHIFTAPDFTYHNFVGLVGDEFEPVLNWESDDAGWFDLDAELSSPSNSTGILSFASVQGQVLCEEHAPTLTAAPCRHRYRSTRSTAWPNVWP